ncbi:MAG: hypothetical protein ACYS0G_05480 [Planctomycetota bacterium]|jgi:hypothetical protein
MSQFSAPARRSGGDLDVYTGVLCAAFLVLVVGVVLLALRNLQHSRVDSEPGGVFKLVE